MNKGLAFSCPAFYTAIHIEGVFYVDILLAWEKGVGTIEAAAQTLVTIQDTVFSPETFQADPSVPDYRRSLKAQTRVSRAKEGVCVWLSSSLLIPMSNTLRLLDRLIWALFISVLCQSSTKREFSLLFSRIFSYFTSHQKMCMPCLLCAQEILACYL